jgi:4-amino-4-deoxy-L-arabinose transferase-like glycosyltransferase
VWGVFALYHLVRRVWDRKRALASAALLALLPAAIYFDRSFLPDPAMVSLVTTSLWMLVAYLQTDKKKYLLLTALIGCLGFLGKITGMLALLPMLYATLTILHARQKLTGPNLLRILVPGLVVVAVVAAYYLWARYLSLHYPPYHFAGSENWLWDEGIGTWLGQSYFLPRAFFIFKNWMWGLPFIVLFISGFIVSFLPARYNKQRASEEPAVPGAPYLFHFWLIGCIVFYLIGAKEQIGNFWNFHLWSPVVAAFSANAVVFLLHTFQKQRVLAWASLAVIGAAIAISNRYVIRNVFTDQYYKADYQMGMHLSSLKKKGDLVVVLARETGCPIPIYYSKGRGWVFPPAGKGKWDQLPASDEECIVTLEELRGKGAAWFGVYEEQYKRLQAGYPKFVQHLATRYPRPVAQPGYVIFKLQHDKN